LNIHWDAPADSGGKMAKPVHGSPMAPHQCIPVQLKAHNLTRKVGNRSEKGFSMFNLPSGVETLNHGTTGGFPVLRSILISHQSALN